MSRDSIREDLWHMKLALPYRLPFQTQFHGFPMPERTVIMFFPAQWKIFCISLKPATVDWYQRDWS